MPAITTADTDDLVRAMRDHYPPRDVYEARNGGYFLTYRGDARLSIGRGAIDEALRRGLIVPKYAADRHYWCLAT